MNRCDRREPIFKDDTDHERFLDTLGEACLKTGWENLRHRSDPRQGGAQQVEPAV